MSESPTRSFAPKKLNPEVQALLQAFFDRCRQGEKLSAEQYVQDHPQCAEHLAELQRAMTQESLPPEASEFSLGDWATVRVSESSMPARLGDFRIIREVGRGGMGVVYEAEQVSLGRRVALKVLPQRMPGGSSVERLRFEREARAAARLHHTNIVPVFGVGEHEGMHYYAMQFIQGLGLDVVLAELKQKGLDSPCISFSQGELRISGRPDRLQQEVTGTLLAGQLAPQTLMPVTERADQTVPMRSTNVAAASDSIAGQTGPSDSPPSSASVVLPGPTSPSSAARARQHTYWHSVALIGAQAAQALQYAHEQGVLHRDVKPSNLMLDLHGAVWVTDFGLAKSEDGENLTEQGDILGTIRYMAPEAFAGPLDARGDVYSLGLTIYELLALRPAFAEPDRSQLIKLKTTTEAPPLRHLNREIPLDLATIVHKAIEHDPADRYQTSGELADDLNRFLHDEPIYARRPSPFERLIRWSRRNRALATSLGSVAALLIVGFISSLIAAGYFRGLSQDLELAHNKAVTISNEKTKLAQALEVHKQELARQLALEEMERGLLLCEQGEVSKGLLWLTRALKSLPAGNDAVDRVIRMNLATWQRQLVVPAAIMRHPDEVLFATFSPDGKSILTASEDGAARLWAVPSGELIGRLQEHQGAVFAATFSPDGQTVATASLDGTARLWNAAALTPLGKPLQHSDPVITIAISPSGKMVLTGSTDGTARMWHIPSGEPATAPLRHDSAVQAACFDPQGKFAATASWDHKVRLWDARSGELLGEPLQQASPVLTLAFSPDGKTLLSGAEDGTVQFWDTERRQRMAISMRHARAVYALGFSRDGTRIFTASDDTTGQVWNAATGKGIGKAVVHQVLSRTAALSPDGNLFLTGSDDHTARLWDANTGLPKSAALMHQGAVRSVQFSPDGNFLLTASHDATVRLWRTPGELPAVVSIPGDGRLDDCAFSADASRLVTRSIEEPLIQLWDTEACEVVGEPIRQHAYVLAINSDASRVLTGNNDLAIQVWDGVTGKPLGEPLLHQSPVRKAVFGPQGLVLTACRDHTAWVWDLAAHRVKFGPLPIQRTVHALAFSPDGLRFVTASGPQQGTAQLWSAETGTVIATLPHQGKLGEIVFSRQGQMFATTSFDRQARLWDSATGSRIGVPFSHPGPIDPVALSADGRLLLLGGYDGTARLWDVATATPIGPPTIHGTTVRAVAFRPDGRTYLSVGSDRSLRSGEIPPPLAGEVARVDLWSQVITAMELTSGGTVSILDPSTWNERRQQLAALTVEPLP